MSASMKDLRKITWFVFWRYTIASMLVGNLLIVISKFIIEFIGNLFGFDKELLHLISAIFGLLSAVVGLFFVLNYILSKAVMRHRW